MKPAGGGFRSVDGKHEVICIEAQKVFDFCFQKQA